MRFTFQNTVIILLLATLFVTSTVLSFILFTAAAIISSIENKLDELHRASEIQINAQGNLTQHSRDVMIKQFEEASNKGGFANSQDVLENQHILKQILGNLTINRK